MSKPRYRAVSLRGPVILFIVVLVLIITLTVFWNVVLARDYQQLRQLTATSDTFHWTFIALGSALFLAIIVMSSILSAQLFSQIRWRQRQSNFIATVSHELNSPLSSIKLLAQTLRNPGLTPENRQSFVEKILSDVQRLSRLIANILRAAEIDKRGHELQVILQDVELCDYLKGYIDDASTLYKESGIELSLSGEAEAWVALDKAMFRQVLDNLVDNAVRYQQAEIPKLDLRLRRSDGYVEIQAVDRGVGLPQSEIGRIFERFYRIDDEAARPSKGTGIGLFVVRSIVEAHDGKVGATSAGPGAGATIWIRLPVTRKREAVL